MKKSAFTMIELIFVIVVLGILAAVAIPKLSATRTDAQISKTKADIASLRSSIISERQGRLLQGESSYIGSLDSNVSNNTADVLLFDAYGGATLLMYGVTTKDANGHWLKTATNQYTYKVDGNSILFTYLPANGTFDCDHSNSYCKILTQ
ncbi:MAG: prepilin-type N-terminal cleavage/methylation domain-containing protein [Helicobacteraceae bacterium]|nr:prepilin-type N-terminal cleavage/methylation domain-containing protein [Helicobacteraceae bacterium]